MQLASRRFLRSSLALIAIAAAGCSSGDLADVGTLDAGANADAAPRPDARADAAAPDAVALDGEAPDAEALDAEASDAAPPDGGVPSGQLAGTAARGAPIAGARVVLKDHHGISRTATTTAAGRFTIDVAGLLPPFLLRVGTSSSALYGVASAEGIANLHPLTDLIIRVFYALLEVSIESAFDNLGSASEMPTPLQVSTLEQLIRRAIARWLQAAGLDPASFDLITSPFDADGTGFDAVLDQTTVIGEVIRIADAATAQTSTVGYDGLGLVRIDTSVRGSGAQSGSSESTLIQVGSAWMDAEAGVLAALGRFRDTVNTRGAALADSDLLPLMASDLLEGGQDRTLYAAGLTGGIRGATVLRLDVARIDAFDGSMATVRIRANVLAQIGPATFSGQLPFSFRRDGTEYKLWGDQRVLDTEGSVQMEMRTDSTSAGEDTHLSINVDATAPQGVVSSVRLTGGPFNDVAVVKQQITRTQTLRPTPTSTRALVLEVFLANTGPVASLPSPGTPFAFTVTPSAGPIASYEVTSNGFSGEPLRYVATPATHSLSAILGQTLTVTWQRPATYAVARIGLSGHVSDGNTQVFVGEEEIPTDATMGTLDFPAVMPGSGNTITEAVFNLSINGPNGERSIVIYSFDQP